MDAQQISVILADDHEMILQGNAAYLAQQPDINILATATNGVQAVQLTRMRKPNVLVLDINMPGKNGEEIAKEILESQPETQIVVVTGLDDVQLFKRLRKLGVKGYLLKEQRIEDLSKAIREVHAGNTYWGQAISNLVMNELIPANGTPAQALTPTEKDVLGYVCTFGTAGEIAHLMGRKESTVQTHLKAMYAKLNLRNRQALNEYARVNGYCKESKR